jgi:3-isopropylmalate dehydrogenase
MLLDWHGARSGRPELRDAGQHLDRAVTAVVADPATRTRDLGGTLGTADFTSAVVDALSGALTQEDSRG